MSRKPIFIVGPPRSGNTWMQWALCEHPLIEIYGHLTRLTAPELTAWLDRLLEGGRLARQWNAEVGYRVAHYAGADEPTTYQLFGEMLRRWASGGARRPSAASWGLKALFGAAPLLERLWPSAFWIVCLRDPWRTYESIVETQNWGLGAGGLADWLAEAWLPAVRWWQNRPRAYLWQTDRLATAEPEERALRMADILEELGRRSGGDPVVEFARAGRIVHKRKPDAERSFRLARGDKLQALAAHPAAAAAIEALGYTIPREEPPR